MAVQEKPYAELGQRIKAARNSTGMSQEEFAPLVGVTRRHLIRLENGRHQVSVPLAKRIAAATGCTVAELRREEEEEPLVGEPFRRRVGDRSAADGGNHRQPSAGADVTEDAA